MDKNLYSNYIQHWSLDQETIFLNHGSFGACPTAILDKQNEYRKRLESQPLRFMLREMETVYLESKEKLANFVGAATENIVFVRNATTGVNTVLKSLKFNAGDEIICCNHIYPGVRNTLNYLKERYSIVIREAEIPFQLQSNQPLIDAFIELQSEQTKLVLIDHISSPTAIVFPVQEIVNHFNEFEIDTLVDGAHAPGTVALSLDEMGAAYYTGNCHKWICSPKGSAFLFVRKDKQENIKPLTTSLLHGKNIDFDQQFSWQGTEDPTAYLCIGDAIGFMEGIYPDKWPGIMQHNHNLAIEARSLIFKDLGVNAAVPDCMIANLASINLPDSKDSIPSKFNQFDSLQNRLFHDFNFEVFITYWPEFPKRLLRISPQIYNTIEQYEFLSKTLKNVFKIPLRHDDSK
ncbi:MAG: aminotransferase class V-fold PLP-dependent enzyme [Bacteroidetes bacterium]|jgi:isopenicillin-N epimerase|nr:aminotransferase class V-fold PLP-dependent enzyme [Bacteroidota bacterium]